MKSGILATTTLLVILGTVEQAQAQTEADQDHEYDLKGFSYGSDLVSAATLVAAEDNQNNGYASLAWQTDFADKSLESSFSEEIAPLSPLPEAQTLFLADLSIESKDHYRTGLSNQFQPHLPPATATPISRSEKSFRELENRFNTEIQHYRDRNSQPEHREPVVNRNENSQPENRSRTAIGNYRDRNSQRSVEYRPRKLGANSINTSPTLPEVLPLSTNQVRQPEIPPLAAATNYLPEAQEEIPVFNGYSWPAQGVITSHYGWRWGRMHNGLDIGGPTGTPIMAAADGVVITSEWHNGGYGNLVEIEHPDGSITLYAHNSENRVRVGEVVKKGQLIAFMGSTGYSTGPHLHFEIHLPGQGAVNPSAYLPSGHSVAHQHW